MAEPLTHHPLRVLQTGQWGRYGSVMVVFIAFTLIRLPDVLVVSHFSALSFALDSLYIGNRLLFDGLSIRPELAGTIATPANAGLIATPGLYLLSAALKSVAGAYWLLFGAQLVFLFSFFRLLCWRLSPLVSALVSVWAAYYLTKTNWWAADWVIQPLMVICISTLVFDENKDGISTPKLAAVGLLAGVIFLFKQNIGVFFALMVSSWLYIGSYSRANALDNRNEPLGRLAGAISFGCIALFVPIFGARVISVDEMVYYLGPYVAFWTLFYLYVRKTELSLALGKASRQIGLFLIFASMIPAFLYFQVGSVIGYKTYWHALFGMGIEFLPIWDKGIINTIRMHMSDGGAVNYYHSGVLAILFALPLVVNSLSVGLLGKNLVFGEGVHGGLRDFQIAGLGIMGALLFFPLEGYHNLATKLFIFIFLLVSYLPSMPKLIVRLLGGVVLVMSLAVMALGASRFNSKLMLDKSSGSPEMASSIGVAIKKELADDIDRQLKVIGRAVGKSGFYGVGHGASYFVALAEIAGSPGRQYYLIHSPQMLNYATVEAIKKEMTGFNYAIVLARDFAERNLATKEKGLADILKYLEQNFELIDEYVSPNENPDYFHDRVNFIVLRRKTVEG